MNTIEQSRQAMAWWNSLSKKDKEHYAHRIGELSLTNIRAYWLEHIHENL